MSSVCLRCASGSDQLQLFVKEQERNKLLCLSDPQLSSHLPSAPATSSTSESAAKDNGKTPPSRRKQKAGKRGRTKDVEEDALVRTVDEADEGFDNEVKSRRKSRAKRNVSEKENTEESLSENPATQPAAGERRYSFHTPTADFYSSCCFHSLHSDETADCSMSTPSAPQPAGNYVIDTCRPALATVLKWSNFIFPVLDKCESFFSLSYQNKILLKRTKSLPRVPPGLCLRVIIWILTTTTSLK